MNSTIALAAKLAVLPGVAVGYVGFMGMTGFCPTCRAMCDWTLGRSADAAAPGVETVVDPAVPTPGANPSAPVGPVHALTLPDLDGGQMPLAELAGRPMLIEVWATWCGPCRTLRSRLEAIAPRLREKATLVAVSVDQGGAAAVKQHLGGRGSAFVELLATPQFRELIRPFDSEGTIPKLVYVDGQGNIAGLEHGVADPKWIEARIDSLR